MGKTEPVVLRFVCNLEEFSSLNCRGGGVGGVVLALGRKSIETFLKAGTNGQLA